MLGTVRLMLIHSFQSCYFIKLVQWPLEFHGFAPLFYNLKVRGCGQCYYKPVCLHVFSILQGDALAVVAAVATEACAAGISFCFFYLTFNPTGAKEGRKGGDAGSTRKSMWPRHKCERSHLP